MKELSIFIDESGDFGEYDHHSPYYIITMVFHDQQEDIQPAVSMLNQELSYLNLDNLCIHTGLIGAFLFRLKCIHILLRCQSAVSLPILIIIHFRIHVIDCSNGQQLQLTDMNTEVMAARSVDIFEQAAGRKTS